LYVFFLGIKSSQVFVTNFPWFCSSTVFQLFSCSRDNSTSYRAAKTSVNPSSRYGKLGFPVLCCFDLFVGWLLIVWLNSSFWCVKVLCMIGWSIKHALCRCEQWWTLLDSPRRACLAQARCAKARPELPARVVAQATRVCFERAHNSSRREGSRLSEIPRCLFVPVEPSPRRKGTRLGETVSPERDPSTLARCWARQCCDWIFVYSRMVCFGWVGKRLCCRWIRGERC